MSRELPLVGVSPCLLGRLVRYDGGHRRSAEVFDLPVRWLEICPEAEAGLGTPREPAQLVRDGSQTRFVGVGSRQDYTEALAELIARRIGSLPWDQLGGWVLKARSPSCGLTSTPWFSPGSEGVPSGLGDGLWAAALRARDPGLPLIDEDGLGSPERRTQWLAAVQQRSQG